MRLILGFMLCIHSIALLAEDGLRIDKVVVEGLTKSEDYVVLTELRIEPGDTVSRAEIDDGIARVKNTNLFVNVRYELHGEGEGQVLTVHAEDRWTTIPIAKFSSGGGVTQIILGIYDPNILGKNLEAGSQYERLGEANSGVVWFKNRRVFNSRFSLDLQFWSINRLRTKYEQDKIEPQIKTGFLHTRRKLFAEVGYEIRQWMRVGLFVDDHRDEFSERYLSDEVKRERTITTLPPDTHATFYGVGVDIGRIDYDIFLVDGMQLNLDYRHANMESDDIKDFDQYDVSALYYKTLPFNITIAQRLMYGGTTTATLQYWYYLGGLDRVRGFVDNRFAGRYFWLSNSEIRVPTYQSPIAVIQNTAFYDIISVGEESKELNEPSGASAGLGLRVIAPKIYRLVARLDYAQPVLKHDERSISFGVQQFF